MSILTKLPSAIWNQCCRYIHVGVASSVNHFQYDNQSFYDNVTYGHRGARNNIRNIKRNAEIFKRSGFQKLTRVRIVDNTSHAKLAWRRNPRVIQVYKKSGFGNVGDMVLITVGGIMKRALIVGQRQNMGVMKARMDSNNVIILDNDGNPEGTRITVPVPAWLRGYQSKTKRPIAMSKVIALSSRFV